MSQVPLVVDLDGTLVRSDLLHEAATAYVLAQPHRVVEMLRWLRVGRSELKHALAEEVPVDPATLPYNSELLSWLRQQRGDGRELVLASASPIAWVQPVADHLGIFDQVMASDRTHNLKAEAKRDALVQAYGAGGFDYVGNHDDDLVVWAEARTAHVVGSDGSLSRKLPATTTVGSTFANPRNSIPDLLRAMRPHQWAKNLLIFVPLLTAQLADDAPSVVHAWVAFVCFCLAASSVYLVNDLADIGSDRLHPTKVRRPFASGSLGVGVGWTVAPLLALMAMVLAAWAVSIDLLLVLVVYLLLTSAYSFVLKRLAIFDVVTLASLYTVRIVAGAVAVSAPLSIWLLTFSLFLFLSLALVKRVSEVARLQRQGGAPTDVLAGRGYQVGDLEMLSSLGVGSGLGSAIVMSLYVSDPLTAELYRTPEILWGAVPILLFWIMRVWLLAHRGQMNEDPVVFAMRDRTSLVAAAMIAVVFLLAKLVS